MAGPLAVETIVQKAGMDCGVAALAMYLTIPYRMVSDAAMKIVPDFIQGGLTRSEMEKIGSELGYDLRRTRKFSLKDDDGVLFMQHRRAYHWVTLFNGSILNPSEGLVWVPEAYMDKTHYRPVTLVKLASDTDEIDNSIHV